MRETLTDCLHETIHGSSITAKAIAEELGVSYNLLVRSALPEPDECATGSGCGFQLKRLIPLIRCTNNFKVLDYIESALGRISVPVPDAQPMQNLYPTAMKAVKEFGHLMAEFEGAMADERLTMQEKALIKKEGYEALQAIASLLLSIDKAA